MERSTWTSHSRRSGRALLVLLSAAVASALLVAAFFVLRPKELTTQQLLAKGLVAFSDKRFEDALWCAQTAVHQDKTLIAAHQLGVDASLALMRPEDTVRCLQGIITNGSDAQAADAAWKAADILLMQLHKPSDAEQEFESAMSGKVVPAGARREFASLLGMCGRVFEASALRIECLRVGDIRDIDLLLLGLGDTASENIETLRLIAPSNPNDPLIKLGLARAAFQAHDLKQADSLLKDVLQQRADVLEAHALRGLVLLASNQAAALSDWLTKLPSNADTYAGIWFVRGEIAERLGKTAAACRCFWEAVRRDPAHQRAHYRLGQLLAGVNHPDAAQEFAQRAAALQQLVLAVKGYNLSHDVDAISRIVPICLQCGLHWEAKSWAAVARAMKRTIPTPVPDASAPRVVLTHDLAQRWKLDDLPLPTWPSQQPSVTQTEVVVGKPSIRFEDQAQAAGLNFHFISGDDLQQPGMRMFEFSGGGVGVLDFDADGWPDLYLTQGGEWPLEQQTHKPLDQLFRNNGQGHFENVTQLARLVEDRYSQGLSIGDINQDGFSDVYVANLGLDRLFLNQGDGTFEDITTASGLKDDDWSTSCVLADFNGDALPDCYVVNYLQGSDLATRVCRNADGRIRACTPHEFSAAPDRLLINNGAGQFIDMTESAGIQDTNGKGLGVVALDADGSGRLSVFVANDTTGNFLWTPTDAPSNGVPKFVERALLAGVALDRDGRSQACMGVAAGDANGDGLIDVLVTNYYDESNTLFRQMTSGLFEDATAKTGLREPSLKQLGFGTQFLDADRDGWLDLIVLNGHVDDERYREIPFQMRPQCFRNLGEGRFVEMPQANCGEWFTKPTLGRALARLDWNRDGRDDFVATHRDEPVGLLTNQTQSLGQGLSLRLIGTRSNRDAIGATIRCKTGSRELARQLVAGDGYQASNDRRLLLSVGANDAVETLTIAWPSGESQIFHDVRSNTEYTLVEGGTLQADRSYEE